MGSRQKNPVISHRRVQTKGKNFLHFQTKATDNCYLIEGVTSGLFKPSLLISKSIGQIFVNKGEATLYRMFIGIFTDETGCQQQVAKRPKHTHASI